mgnify:CR=1 FL=1
MPDTTQERIAELPRDEYCRGVARRQCRLASCTIEVQQLACASALCAADAVGRCEQLPEAEDSVVLPSRLDEHGRASSRAAYVSFGAFHQLSVYDPFAAAVDADFDRYELHVTVLPIRLHAHRRFASAVPLDVRACGPYA